VHCEEEFVRTWSGLERELLARLWQGGASFHEAEEIVQETCARLWQHWHRVHPEARRAWAWKVCHNLWMERWREERRQRAVTAQAGRRLRVDEGDPLLAAVERQDEALEWRRAIEALWRLSLRDRLALWLTATAPSLAAAAAALGINWISMRVRVRRARRRLTQALATGA
jgi:RNA polymerase sigma factor (sigma-70 family)